MERPDSRRFHEAFVRACIDRRFFVTRKGLLGIGPDAIKEGDVLVINFVCRKGTLCSSSLRYWLQVCWEMLCT
jgi:hypothetical protein